MKAAIAALLLVIMTGAPAHALQVASADLPSSLKVDGKLLILNGVGIRTKLVVKVYAGALYLLTPSFSADAIIVANEPMAIRLHFIYDSVSPEKLTEAWTEGVSNATSGDYSHIEKELKQFNGYFTEPAVKDDVFDLIFRPGQGTSVSKNGTELGVIEGLEFKKALFGIWLGPKPPNKDLKNGMLGR